MKYPVVVNTCLYHWGTLDSNKINKSGSSFEGNNLSLSTCPEDWSKLLRLNQEDKLFKFEKKEGLFVDILSLLYEKKYNSLKEEILNESILNGYLDKKEVFKYEFEDENETICHMIFETKEEALKEGEEEDIKKVIKYVGTDKLRKLSGINKENALLSGEEYGIIECIKSDKKVDGIFWNYKKDISSYSLPIHCIFPEKVNEWKISNSLETKNNKKNKMKYK